MPLRQSTFIQKLVISPYRKREIPFIIFSFFLMTFLFVRAGYYLFPNIYLEIRGVHVHHFTYGIILLTVVGYYLLSRTPGKLALHRLAILYGIALGLAYDEFRLWLRLEDNYWTKRSYDAVIIIALLFSNILYFGDFWSKFGGRTKRILLTSTIFLVKKLFPRLVRRRLKEKLFVNP